MIVGIHQPHYLPWLRYFDKLARCDTFILLDDVDFTKNGWQNRNKIKSANGPLMLTVPVQQKAGQKINEVTIADKPWARRHWQSITQCYRSAPHFEEFAAPLEPLYQRSWTSLVDLNVAMLEPILKSLDISIPLVRSSQLSVEAASTDRIVDLVKAVGGTAYLTGAYALEVYLDGNAFEQAGLELKIHNWKCGEYPQRYPRAGFVPDLAFLDLLFMQGRESLETLARFSSVSTYELRSC